MGHCQNAWTHLLPRSLPQSRRPILSATLTCGRNALSAEAMITTLKTLRLYGMAQAIEELARHGENYTFSAIGLKCNSGLKS